jgi:hypothetical protein
MNRHNTKARHGTLLTLEPLERRFLLAVDPVHHYLWQPGGYLSPPSQNPPLDIAVGYVESHFDQLGLEPSDFQEYSITSQYADADTGVTHTYLRQQLNGADQDNTNLSINVADDGQVINVGGGFIAGLEEMSQASGFSQTPTLTAVEALAAATLTTRRCTRARLPASRFLRATIHRCWSNSRMPATAISTAW